MSVMKYFKNVFTWICNEGNSATVVTQLLNEQDEEKAIYIQKTFYASYLVISILTLELMLCLIFFIIFKFVFALKSSAFFLLFPILYLLYKRFQNILIFYDEDLKNISFNGLLKKNKSKLWANIENEHAQHLIDYIYVCFHDTTLIQ